MLKLFLLIFMLYMHIVADYYNQGILASMQQRDWWTSNKPAGLFKHDYIVALIEHAFYWTVNIHTPAVIYGYFTGWHVSIVQFILIFVIMWLCHALIDHVLANEKSINLIMDQMFHIFQILVVWFVYAVNG